MDLWRKILLKGGANGSQILKISYMTWTSCDFEQFGYILSNWENGRGRCNLKIADIWQGEAGHKTVFEKIVMSVMFQCSSTSNKYFYCSVCQWILRLPSWNFHFGIGATIQTIVTIVHRESGPRFSQPAHSLSEAKTNLKPGQGKSWLLVHTEL